MRVIEHKPGVLHAFISQEERDHIIEDDPRGQWLREVVLTLLAEAAAAHNRPYGVYTILKENPNIP